MFFRDQPNSGISICRLSGRCVSILLRYADFFIANQGSQTRQCLKETVGIFQPTLKKVELMTAGLLGITSR